MKTKFFAFLILLMFSISTAFAQGSFTVEYEQNPQTNVVRIFGAVTPVVSHKMVTLRAVSDQNGRVAASSQTETDSEGKFEFEFKITTTREDFSYTVSYDNQKQYGTFRVVSPTLKQQLTEIANGHINKDELNELMSFCEEHLVDFDFSLPEDINPVNKLSVYKWILGNGAVSNSDALKEVYTAGSIKQQIFEETNLKTAVDLIEKYKEKLKINTNPSYETFVSLCQNGFSEAAIKGLKSEETNNNTSFQTLFSKISILKSIELFSWGAINDVITKNTSANLLNIDLNRYNRVSETVCRSISGTAFSDLTTASKQITSIIDAAIAKLNSGSVGGSVGGSTGNTGRSVEFPVLPTPTPEAEEPTNSEFEDLDSVLWAQESITYLYKNGIINGKSEKAFFPNDEVTREEFIKMVTLSFGIKESYSECPFSDVEKDSWYEKYVTAAYENGISNGNDGIFGVGEKITRQDMAVIIYRVFDTGNINLSGAELSFFDTGEISDYAVNAVESLVSKQIINGVGDNLFSPKSTATRAQAAKILFESIKVWEEIK